MILAADFHLRKNPPRSRIDDYFAAQERKLRFILKLARESPPLTISGDLFDQARPGPFLERWIIELLKEYDVRLIVVPGQHDMPGHSLEQLPDSGLGVLAAAEVITILKSNIENFYEPPYYDGNGAFRIWGCPYGQEPVQPRPDQRSDLNILLWHHMVIDSPLWPGQVADYGHGILRKYPQFDIIVTGDNHKTFVMSLSSALDGKDRLLINPGSMMRQTAAQVSHRPCVFKWESGKLEQIFLPIEQDVLDLTDLEQAKEKDGRISAFVESLDKQYEIGLGYTKNIEYFLNKNQIKELVRKIVWKCLES